MSGCLLRSGDQNRFDHPNLAIRGAVRSAAFSHASRLDAASQSSRPSTEIS
jgi:hypothetical protein